MKKPLLLILLFSLNFCRAQVLNFEAKGLIYLQDADFNVFTNSTKTILKAKASVDRIGSFMFPLNLEDQISELAITNSVYNNHKAVAVRNDNRLCYILESRGTFKKEDLGTKQNVRNLPIGAFVSVVDISNLRKIQADYRFSVASNPTALALNKANDYLAVSSEGSEQELEIFELNELGKPIRIVSKTNAVGNGAISDIQWHPSGDYLAFVKSESKEIGFLKIVKDPATQKIVKVEILGNNVKLDGMPFTGTFSKDGRFFYVLDKRYETNAKSFGYNGQVYVVKFNADGQNNHFLVSKAEAEENPSAMAVHPSGKWIAVLNMKKTFDYPIKNDQQNLASISILALDNEGAVSNVGNFAIDGILPKSIVFDKNGNNLAVAIFQYFSYGKAIGGIDFYRFKPTENLKIEKQTTKINTLPGTHYLKVIEDF